MTITLTSEEIKWAALCGAMRRIRAIEIGRTHKYKCESTGFAAVEQDAEGCMAELAAANAIGVHWPGEHDQPDYPGDLEDGIHVRGTKHSSGRLILHENDPDGEIFILVCGSCPTYNVAGYIFSDQGKRTEYWTDPTRRNRPAYFVPQSALRPIEELRDYIAIRTVT